jgi:hypothetical protein
MVSAVVWISSSGELTRPRMVAMFCLASEIKKLISPYIKNKLNHVQYKTVVNIKATFVIRCDKRSYTYAFLIFSTQYLCVAMNPET